MPGKYTQVAHVWPPIPAFSFLPSPDPKTTPPIHQFEPYAGASLTPVQIHPVLGYSDAPYLNYDISCPPSTIMPYDRSLPRSVLTNYATKPPLPSLVLTSPYIRWTLTIAPTDGKYVTVNDVLHGLYRQLRTRVSQEEYDDLPSESAKQRVCQAYRRRCARIADPIARKVEASKWLKRIDFFAESNKFMGLESTTEGPHVWTICVS